MRCVMLMTILCLVGVCRSLSFCVYRGLDVGRAGWWEFDGDDGLAGWLWDSGVMSGIETETGFLTMDKRNGGLGDIVILVVSQEMHSA